MVVRNKKKKDNKKDAALEDGEGAAAEDKVEETSHYPTEHTT
jgi:hypothetical protein